MKKIKIADITVSQDSTTINDTIIKSIRFHLGDDASLMIVNNSSSDMGYSMNIKVKGCKRPVSIGTIDKLSGDISDTETIRVTIETLIENAGIEIPYSSNVINWMANNTVEALIKCNDEKDSIINPFKSE